jgi:hypothetical protein
MIINYLQPESRYYSQDKAALEDYDKRIEQYNTLRDQYVTDFGIYEGRVGDFNKTVEDYNTRLNAWKKQAEDYNKAIEKWNEGARTTPFENVDYYVERPSEWSETAPQFGYSPPTAPDDPGFDQMEVDEFIEYAQDRAQRRGQAASAAQQALQSGAMGHSGLSSSGSAVNISDPGNTAGLAVGFEEGGMVPGLAFANSMRQEQALSNMLGSLPAPTGPMTQAIGEDGGGGAMLSTMAMGEEPQAPTMSPPQKLVAASPAMTRAIGEEQGSQMGGVGGLFQNQFNQFGSQMANLQGSPLKNYENYLMATYGQPKMEQMGEMVQGNVSEFVDLVDQAERAHFGAEESFGYGGGDYHNSLMNQFSSQLPQPLQQAQATEAPQSLQGLGSLTAQLFEEGGAVSSISDTDLRQMREKVINDYGFDPFDIAMEEGVDPDLFLRVMYTENRGKQGPRSKKGAIGLMQLMPGTAEMLGIDPFDPIDNARGGARYLKQQLEEFQSVPLALAAYNAGPGNVKKYGGVPPFEETRNYVAQIYQVAEDLIQPAMGDFYQREPGQDPVPKPKLRPEGFGQPGFVPTPPTPSEFLVQTAQPPQNTAPDPRNIPMLQDQQRPVEEEEASAGQLGDFYKDYTGFDLALMPLRQG